MSKELSINVLKKDKRNANRGTDRGQELLESSFKKYGAGRSILVDKDLNIIAGNHAFEEARRAGIKDIIVVPADGSQLVVVQRTDVQLDSKKGREMAIIDNTSAKEGIDLDPEMLEGLSEEFDLEIDMLGVNLGEPLDLGAGEEDEGEGEGAGSGKSKADKPSIFIEMNKSQMKGWEQFKKKHGFDSDEGAFFSILAHAKESYGK